MNDGGQEDKRADKSVTKTAYRQNQSQGPIYNGDISDGVNAFHERSVSLEADPGPRIIKTSSTDSDRSSGGHTFSGSHSHSKFEKIITAGNDVHMPTYNVHLNAADLTTISSTHKRAKSDIIQQVIQPVISLFQSFAHRAVLVHSLPGEAEKEDSSGMSVQCNVDDLFSQEAPLSHTQEAEDSDDNDEALLSDDSIEDPERGCTMVGIISWKYLLDLRITESP